MPAVLGLIVGRPCAMLPEMAGSSPAMTTAFCEEDSWTASLLFLLVHREHALRDQEAAKDVHRGEDEREEAEQARPDRAGVVAQELDTHRKQRADHDHRRNRVGH